MIKIIFFAIGLGSCLMAPARAFARIELPFGSSVMFCGDPDSRDTAKDGTFTCVNYYKRAVKNATFTLKNGKLDGPAFGYSENDGAPVMEGHFKAGEKDGEFRENWSAEKKRFQEITHFRKGLREGIRLTQNDENDGQNISYYKNDQKFGYTLRLEGEKIANVSECEVAGQEGENSKCDSIIIPGYEKQWSAFKGVTAAKNEVAHNTANAFIEKKNAKGVLVERYQQKDNQIDGKHEIFYDNGKLHFLNVESASRIAEQSEYFDDGHLKRKSKFDLSHGGTGIETERFEFYQNGKPKLESKTIMQKDGSFTRPYKEYFDNGRVKQVGSRSGHLRSGLDQWSTSDEGPFKTYNDAGKLISEENYVKGKREGLSRYIKNDAQYGPVLVEESWHNDILEKRVESDPKSKKRLRETTYMPDGSVKSEKH